jgi:lipopolysaccharide export system protein LptA
MIYRKACLFVLCIIFLTPYSLYAQDNPTIKEDLITKDEPIDIVSDHMDVSKDEKLVKFVGNATAKQGDKLLKADQFLLYYKKDADNEGKGVKTPLNATSQMEKIEAKGNVSTTQGERIVTSDEAVYYHNSGQVILIGNVVMREGNNIIKGCKATVYLNENRGKVEECEPEKKQRVHARIYRQTIKKEGIGIQ